MDFRSCILPAGLKGRPPRRAGGLTSLVAMFTGLAVVSGLLTYWVMAGS